MISLYIVVYYIILDIFYRIYIFILEYDDDGEDL